MTANECYERKFVKNTLINLKKIKVEQLLKIIEDQIKGQLEKAVDEGAVAEKGFI